MLKLTKYNYYREFGLELKPMAKAILEEILGHANKQGFCYPSQETIARNLHISRFTVIKHLKKIKAIKINGLPFIKIIKVKCKDGRFAHNRYYFPWILQSELYLKEYRLDVLDKLQMEYSDIVLQEEINKSHVDISNINIKEDRFNYFYLADYIKKLSTLTGLKASKTLETIVCVADYINEGNIIYDFKNFLKKSLINAGMIQKSQKQMLKVYDFLGLANKGNAIFGINWNKVADSILAM